MPICVKTFKHTLGSSERKKIGFLRWFFANFGLEGLFFRPILVCDLWRAWIDSLTFCSSLLALPQKSSKESNHPESIRGIVPALVRSPLHIGATGLWTIQFCLVLDRMNYASFLSDPFSLHPIPFLTLSVSASIRIDGKGRLCRIPLCILRRAEIISFRVLSKLI
jgi:hypothetical protein